jgi:CubicO group peptidase (beta-lactamase class C family)
MPADQHAGEPATPPTATPGGGLGTTATAPGGRPGTLGGAARPPAPTVQGWCDPAFGPVREVFAGHFADGEEVGAAVCVYLAGTLVADLWGGVADTRTGRPWQRDTPCLAFSCTKALTTACALHLWERGGYEMDAPVTTWWPEFGQAGKDQVTAAHLLSHQAGLPAFDGAVSVADTADPAGLAARLAAQAPEWAPGTEHGYHALTFGWLAGEIVRRLSGRPVGEYAAAHITGPHELDMWLGAPDDVIARAARLTNRPPSAARATASAPAPTGAAGRGSAPPRPTGRPAALLRADAASSLLWRTIYNPDATSVPGGHNNPQVLRAGWPASGVVTTAAGLAGFYRHLAAGRVLDPATLTAALAVRASGKDKVLSIESAFGLGFMRPSLTFPVPAAGRASAFGHTGLGGAIGLADVSRGLAMAYVPNRMGDEMSGALRAYRLVEAVYAAIG